MEFSVLLADGLVEMPKKVSQYKKFLFISYNVDNFLDLAKNSELMWQQSVCSSLISATIAANYLKPGGVIQLTGAKAALEATPGDY